jgi:tetratricopeptide (TPR) repeat protein
MAPLFQAMHHGCQAGRHQEALNEVFWVRIRRGVQAFSLKQLGAFSADLAALAGSFDPPFKSPVGMLAEADRAFILGEAAYNLRALGRLREGVAPQRAGLERMLALGNWGNAAAAAANLSELHLLLGDVTEAVETGEMSVVHADWSEDGFQRMFERTAWANALHQAGEAVRAQALFEEAEALQAERQPTYPKLYSVQGYRYCDLLLTQGHPAEVRKRAAQTLEWALHGGQGGLLTIALEHLSLGRAALALGDHTEGRARLDKAVDGLRQGGDISYFPRGLLARAALFREMGDPGFSRRDLDEAMRIARRSEMGLFQCDAHLEYARLALAAGNREEARKRVAEARRLVEETGYGRRRPEVEELEAQVR